MIPLPLAAAATGIGIFGQGAARRRTQRAQDAAIDDWLAYQEDAKNTAEGFVDANREANYGYLDGALSGATEEARTRLIGDETDRLFGLMGPEDRTVSDQFSNNTFRDYHAKNLAKATQEARDMIRAQAKTKAYGGSYGGMGTTRRRDLRTAAEGIGFGNEKSGIDLGVLAQHQRVQPVMYQHQSTGLGELLTGIGSSALGAGIADMFGAGSAGAAPASSGSTVSGWRPQTYSPAPAAAPGFGFGTIPPINMLFPPNPNLRF